MAPRLNALQRDTVCLWLKRVPDNRPRRVREVFNPTSELARMVRCVEMIAMEPPALTPAGWWRGTHRYVVAPWARQEAKCEAKKKKKTTPAGLPSWQDPADPPYHPA